ncbi:hypothetical protein NST81_17525 [Bacillus sp. FSL W8-0223]|uniref:hypothetical protein n=1 Tax=Bacillus sp. FSL W8-0223 TaxID=2954595 RepID=UPI0030FD1AAD
MSDEKEQLTLLIQESFKNLYQYLDLKFKEVDANFEAVNSRLEKLEANSNEDVVALLKQIQKNTKGLSTDIEYLAEKVGKHEMILNRIQHN